MAKESPVILFNVEDAKQLKSRVEFIVGKFNALMLMHEIRGEGAQGYLAMDIRYASGKYGVPHHGKGVNIKTDHQSNSYSSIYEGITDFVGITLHAKKGSHLVYAIPMNI